MAGRSILEFFRDAPWLTRRRLAVYPKLFLVVYVISAVVWLMRSKDLIDPAGHPIGADFIDPWSASWLTLHGAPSAVYDVARLWSVERMAVNYPNVGFAGFHYPPTYLLIVLPLALLPYAWSLLVWTVANFAAYLALMWQIDRERDSLWLAIAFPGALVNLTNGQNGFLTLALLGGALLTLERRPILAGVMFGLMSYKPRYGLLVPIFLLATGRWRAIVSASITVVLFAALSLAMFGEQTWQAFFSSVTFTRHVVLEQGRQRIREAAERLRGRAPAELQRRDILRLTGSGQLGSRDRRNLDMAANRQVRSPRRRACNRHPARHSLRDGLRLGSAGAADRMDCARRCAQ